MFRGTRHLHIDKGHTPPTDCRYAQAYRQFHVPSDLSGPRPRSPSRAGCLPDTVKRLGEAAPSTKAERCAPRIARETAQVSCIPGSVFHFAKKDSRRLRATRRPTISDRQRVIPLPHRTWSTPTDIAGRKNLLTIVLRQIPEAAGVCPGFCMPTICMLRKTSGTKHSGETGQDTRTARQKYPKR